MLIHHAAGGVGTAVAQICNALGASLVIGTASAPKRDFVESLGMRFVDGKRRISLMSARA